MSEQEPTEPKKYYEYFYTWRMAESMRKKHERNGRNVCAKPMRNRTGDTKEWVIWYQREQDNRVLPTANARYYDK